ncbi:LuxR C-terminal-related transcriptional regulator [Evansella sp. LMS18]|uniref:response regulator transcription factor n=1 Tax=Evansella sp. LMS18 TaxID=2924033 RepID=UPI0020D12009|nr:LuxR C-terminal-related transcriptional regulator [Evansella sp. LMS18]UTR11990.1 LuxR C-terminal-related transcriptional regulator [Evansella sp. LMS18]
MGKNRGNQLETDVIFMDPTEQISIAVKERINKRLSLLISEEGIPPATIQKNRITLVTADGFSEKKLRHLLSEDMLNDKKASYVLISKNKPSLELLSFLEYPVGGIVSLPFLERYMDIVLKSLLIHEIFMEPSIHLELIEEIQKKRGQKRQINRLQLIEESHFIFSEKEMDILQLILDGYSMNEIANKMYFANSTIATHVGAIMKKLNANDRTTAVRKAIKIGLVVAKK